MTDAAESPLVSFFRTLSVSHHVPGRIRLKLSASLTGDILAMAADAKRFSNAFSSMAGIRSVRLNPLAKSCTIEYDAKMIPPAAWSGFLSGSDSPESEILETMLKTAARA